MIQAFKDENEFIKFAAAELMTAPMQVTAETLFRSLQTWSSLNALIFVSRIHEEAGVLISSEDLAQMKTFGDVYQLIISKENGAV
ncbi:MAG: acyl carrier protein [Bacteroidota bacterium]